MPTPTGYTSTHTCAELDAAINAVNDKYEKPNTGIPKTDLANSVQTSLGKADTALQSYTETDPVFTASAAHGISSTDISNWNAKGTYSKPSGGIPKTDLASAVQTSLGKADTALQSYTETDPVFAASVAADITSSDISNWNSKTSNIGTITGINMNGTSKGTSGVVDLGTVITAHQDISGKADKATTYTKTEVDDIVDNYLPLSGGTMTGAVTFKAGNATSSSQGFNLGTMGHVGASSKAVGVYSVGSIYIRPNQTLGESATSVGLSITDTSLTYNTYPILHSNNYSSYALPLSGGDVTGYINLVSKGKGLWLTDSTDTRYAGIQDNGANLWIGANATTGTHHTGETYISAGSGQAYISRLVDGTRNNYKILDFGNTYVTSGKGYINGTEITTVSGNAFTATTLATSRIIWGRNFNGSANIRGALWMLSDVNGATNNSASAKLKFNSNTIDGDEIQRSPYIQAIPAATSSYGRKRLSVFQSNAANYTDRHNEVFTILPDGKVGIGTVSPSQLLEVAGNVAITGTLTLGGNPVAVVYSGSTAPSSSTGSDGDIYIQTS